MNIVLIAPQNQNRDVVIDIFALLERAERVTAAAGRVRNVPLFLGGSWGLKVA